jgi:hypothetical protein
VKFIGNAIGYVGLYFIYMASFGNSGDGIYWPGLLLGGVVAMVGVGVTKIGLHARQDREDTKAQRTLRAGDLKGHALYLRSFETDGKFEIKRDSGDIFDWDQFDRAGADSIERLMAGAFERSGLLIGAGGHGGAELGAAAGGYLEDWQPVVAKAIQTASWIVIIPSAQPGTLWEIGKLQDCGALGKTIFVMPPSADPISYSGPVPLSRLWASAREACEREYGMMLPAYDRYGALFRIDPRTRAVSGQTYFDVRSPGHLSDAINSLL